jgi:hypothetical protein
VFNVPLINIKVAGGEISKPRTAQIDPLQPAAQESEMVPS